MSEAMTVEKIIEADLLLQGFWTRLRFPFQTKNRGWSDIDVVAYQPEKKHLVIAESKVKGQKRDVYAYTEHTKNKYGDILTYDASNYFGFLDNIKLLCSNDVIFKNFNKMVQKLTIQLVSNYYISDKVIEDAKLSVQNRISKDVPKKYS